MASVNRTRTDTLSGTGVGPTTTELYEFLGECPADGHVKLTSFSGDIREGSSWSITVTSEAGAPNIRDDSKIK